MKESKEERRKAGRRKEATTKNITKKTRTQTITSKKVTYTYTHTSHTEAYRSKISLVVVTASSAVACAVCPSCHKNSALKR